MAVGVGEDHIHKQWFPVVPNSYLDADLLLGTDVLSRAPFTWNGNKNLIVWGNSFGTNEFIVSFNKCEINSVRKLYSQDGDWRIGTVLS